MKLKEKRKGILRLSLLMLICLIGARAFNNSMEEASIMMNKEIKSLFAYVLEEKEVAFQYLGYSGIILRTSHGAIIIDPADKMKGDEIKSIPPDTVNLILFTHDHYDHFHHPSAVALYKATGATIIAEANVVNRLKGDIPADKLVVASIDKPFQLGNIIVRAIKGSHVGPIMLYQIAIGDLRIFHGADSDYVPLSGLSAEVAFLPAGEPSPTASPQAALNMATDLKPKFVVAIHGSSRQYQDLEKLVQGKLKDTKVIVPSVYSVNKIKLD